MKSKKLPAGLTPVMAGRMGLWLLGNRQHRRSLHRVTSVPINARAPAKGMVAEACDLLAIWTVTQYPGRNKVLANILGIGIRTAEKYCSCRDGKLPARHAARLSDYLETKAHQELDLAYRLREYGTARAIWQQQVQDRIMASIQRSQMAKRIRARQARDAEVAAAAPEESYPSMPV